MPENTAEGTPAEVGNPASGGKPAVGVADAGTGVTAESKPRVIDVSLIPSNVWRIGFVVIAVIAVALLLSFILDDGGSVLFTVLMAWFASIAMEPAVSRLAKRMRRGVATGLVMLGVVVFLVLFSFAFGRLLIEQVADLISTGSWSG